MIDANCGSTVYFTATLSHPDKPGSVVLGPVQQRIVNACLPTATCGPEFFQELGIQPERYLLLGATTNRAAATAPELRQVFIR